ILQGFGVAFALLLAVSTAITPDWPFRMLAAPRITPPPTDYFEFRWIGTTLPLLLKAFGTPKWIYWPVYSAIILGGLWAILATAMDRARSLRDVLGVALIAVFFVTPYGRH